MMVGEIIGLALAVSIFGLVLCGFLFLLLIAWGAMK